MHISGMLEAQCICSVQFILNGPHRPYETLDEQYISTPSVLSMTDICAGQIEVYDVFCNLHHHIHLQLHHSVGDQIASVGLPMYLDLKQKYIIAAHT